MEVASKITKLVSHPLHILISAVVGPVLICFLLTGSGVLAQSSAPPAAASQPTPFNQPRAGDGSTQPGNYSTCPARPEPGFSDATDVIVTLDRSSIWRPRGGEVQFTVGSRSGKSADVVGVHVCLGWSLPPSASQVRTALHALIPAPIVRSIQSNEGGALYGAVIPDLPSVGTPWTRWGRMLEVGYSAFYTVPVADMVLVVATTGGKTVTLLFPVGVTSVLYALFVVALCFGGFFLAAWFLAGRDRYFLLRMISSRDGYASLSQFQILLWTVTVGASAVYVMVLSGNLIDLTAGTLVLLGIAGGVAIAVRIPTRTSVIVPGGTTVPAEGAATGLRLPAWSDLVVVGDGIDLTRVQMLVFTLISAAFVALKVIVGYIIPDIPPNFLVLMGISNSIYVAGRQLPDRSSDAKAP